MGGYGFGFGHSRRSSFSIAGTTVAEQLSQHGVTFSFAAPRPVGQYANGDWWVLGPVSITSISPEAALHDGVRQDGTSYTGRAVHGTMVNPGNRSFASGGLAANNRTNTVQGWDSITQAGFVGVAAPYSVSANVDPGATGSPLNVASGSVVKFVSRLTNLPINVRPAGNDMIVLTVVDAIPASDAIRPGVSRASKASMINASQFDLSVFQNLAPTPGAPTYVQALNWIDRYHEASLPDTINNIHAKGINNHPEYGRDIGNNLHRALLCLHLNSFTPEQKITLLTRFAAIADDLVSRAEEGSITLGAGGGNQWKLPTIVVCAAALGPNVPASWLTWLSGGNRNIWAENSQIFRVQASDIALARYTADGRPRSPFTYQMLGSAEWGEQHSTAPQNSGSNWNLLYRDIVGYSLIGGVLAVDLTTGGRALWDHPDFWLYMDSLYGRRLEGGSGNQALPFVREMLTAYRVAKTAAPAILETGIRDTAVWIRFDQALNELAAPPATSSFVVNVNGSPRAVSSVSVWRQNAGLVLAAPVSGNDVVTVSYAGGANRLRSVDNVNVAAFAGRVVTNRSDRVGGPNAAFPIVRFTPSVRRTIGGANNLAASNSPFGTFALLKFKFAALPPSNSEIFGNNASALPFRLFLNTNGTLELRVTGPTGNPFIIRAQTPPLTADVEYDILWSFDMTQASNAAGINCYVNGAVQALSFLNWAGGAGVVVGWTRAGTYQWNYSGNLTFDLGAFWLDTTTRVDLTSASNRARFTKVTAGNLDILTRGDGITGSIPAHFHVGDADQWNDGNGINRGTGSRLFATSGLVALQGGTVWI